MQNFKLFSVAQREAAKDGDVYQYEQVPQPLRVQVFNIALEQLGDEMDCYKRVTVKSVYTQIVHKLCDEYGLHTLQGKAYATTRDVFRELTTFLNSEQHPDRFLDAVQLIAYFIETCASHYRYRGRSNTELDAKGAVEQINRRMRENGFGFQYIDGSILRVDSEYLHSEAVLPSLRLLNSSEFAGPQSEFMNAHEHFRHGRNKEAMNDALKAFESTMKAICSKRGWPFDANKATAAPLVSLCLEKGLVPEYMQSKFSALRSLLADGIPTVRNRNSAHGQGVDIKDVPDHIAAYCLHMTAAAIVFLCESDLALP
jgi:hypothetical protein